MNKKTLTVILHKEDNMYIAECVEVGTLDQGETIEEAIENLREATKLYLEESPYLETQPRLVTTMEVTYGDFAYA
jgi:predicted RNase H-like HicB family nuclease